MERSSRASRYARCQAPRRCKTVTWITTFNSWAPRENTRLTSEARWGSSRYPPPPQGMGGGGVPPPPGGGIPPPPFGGGGIPPGEAGGITFKKAIGMLLNGEHLTVQGIETLKTMAKEMNKNRSFEEKWAFCKDHLSNAVIIRRSRHGSKGSATGNPVARCISL